MIKALIQHQSPGRSRRSLIPARPLMLAGVVALLAATPALAQNWQTPYTPGSAADLTLRFNNGAGGNGTAPVPPYTVVLNVNTTTPGVGSGGGWSLSGIGAASIGTNILPLGSTQTRTNVGSSTLGFQMVSNGVTEIVGLSLGSQWLAETSITGSDSWLAPSNNFRYTFDLLLSNDVITLSPSIFSGVLLTIEGNSGQLFQGSVQSILPSLLPIATGVSVDFAYDPTADGPLNITWSGNGTVNTQLLSLLGNGTSTLFSVSNGSIQVDAIPEPGTYALMGIAGAALAFIRRRRVALPA